MGDRQARTVTTADGSGADGDGADSDGADSGSAGDASFETRWAQAPRLFEQALELQSSFGQPGVREKYRELLERVTSLGEAILKEPGADEGSALKPLTWVLVQAYAARAEDARSGAGQLARGSQRAPTFADCEDGWARVEEIVVGAEACAHRAEALAIELDKPRARTLAGRAWRSAQAARELIVTRNHAYTFHADPGFSFGEGWYLGAAGVLGGVTIQVEPNKPHSAAAEHFLRAIGVGPNLVPYRSRPRANKALPEIVARAFRADPRGAQRRLRAAFLGEEPLARAVVAWVDERVSPAHAGKKVLLWVRSGTHQAERNTKPAELLELCGLVRARGLVPVLVGDAFPADRIPHFALDCTLFWKAPVFQTGNMRRAQLQFFEYLRVAHGLVGQLGVTTAGMDGPALMGLPTLYLTAEPNVRLGRWVGAVPGYEELVRKADVLQRVARTLERWSA